MLEDGQKQYQPFENDIQNGGAYQYTTGARYSARVANARISELAATKIDLRGQRVLDIGCGDGTYTFELFHHSHPKSIHGIDLSAGAIATAASKSPDPSVTFSTCSGSKLPFPDDSFDVAHLRGVLHHMDHPAEGVAEALRVARKIFIVEPNGWNPILKVIEKVSKYHREHGERSYSSRLIESWCVSQGAQITQRSWAGLVPFFCPEAFARFLKSIEPMVESVPIARQLSCAVFAVTAERPATGS